MQFANFVSSLAAINCRFWDQGEFESTAKGFRAALAFEEEEGKKIFNPKQMPVWESMSEAEEALGNWAAVHEAYLLAIAVWDKRVSQGTHAPTGLGSV